MTTTTDSISKETHEALVQSAVASATKTLDSALADKTQELETAKARIETLESEKAELAADNERVNGELDSAQVELRTATQKVSDMEAAQEKAEQEAAKAELASKRAEQVKGLGLFTEEYATEKASQWADLDEAAWSSRVEEWQKLAPTQSSETPPGDSAMSGSNGAQDQAAASSTDTTKKPSARRAVLGLS